MKKFMTFSLLMLTVLLTGQTQQFVDHYDLRKNPGSRGLVESILVAAMSGKIQAYDYKKGQPNNLSVYELKNRLILEKEPEFEKWDSTVSYYIGDRVKYNDQVFEAIYDPLQGMNPGTGDYWITVSSGDTYFLPSDIAILKIQFAQLKKTRVNQWAHFSVPAEITVEGIERYQFSFRWDDLEKLLDQTNLVFYDYMLPEMGWITGSLFSFDDSFPQGSLIREVAQYAFSKSAGSRIYGKATDWNMLENSGYFPKLSFKWVDNSIDSIRLYVPAEHSSQHIADVHYQTFITKLISNKKLTFKGFRNLSSAIQHGILKPFDRDTINASLILEPVKEKKIAKKLNSYHTRQRWEFPMDAVLNTQFNNNEDVLGQYVLNAILNGKFNDSYLAYTNDSLIQRISNEEILDRITKVLPFQDTAPWDPGSPYYTSDRVTYTGAIYECLIDHNGTFTPNDSPDYWILIDSKPIFFGAHDFSNFYLHYEFILDEKGQITMRSPVAATILVFDDTSGLFKSIMAIGIETFKNILSDNSVGASGAQYWNWIKNENLTGVYLDNKPIRKFN